MKDAVMVGRVWKEADSRFERFVRVLFIDNESGSVVVKNTLSPQCKPTVCSLKRFGKSGGYKLEASHD